MLVSRLSASSLFGFEALFLIAWVGADAIDRYNVLLGVLLARTPVPTATVSPLSRHRGTLYLPVIDLAPRGEGGMVASAEKAESSANSASSDRPSAVLPTSSALPEGSSHGSCERKKNLFVFLYIYIIIFRN